eukprot:TRINITY_DN4068_c0_g1_i20.p1 TRINITY_DN4068_c0_g1~~TRINITY_DN4068_c0_g1_i20.p1  ORF type:complete len:342 (+),score=53.68 TRINITY_DN4068_c0_g1_i20:64-1089(+)
MNTSLVSETGIESLESHVYPADQEHPPMLRRLEMRIEHKVTQESFDSRIKVQQKPYRSAKIHAQQSRSANLKSPYLQGERDYKVTSHATPFPEDRMLKYPAVNVNPTAKQIPHHDQKELDKKFYSLNTKKYGLDRIESLASTTEHPKSRSHGRWRLNDTGSRHELIDHTSTSAVIDNHQPRDALVTSTGNPVHDQQALSESKSVDHKASHQHSRIPNSLGRPLTPSSGLYQSSQSKISSNDYMGPGRQRSFKGVSLPLGDHGSAHNHSNEGPVTLYTTIGWTAGSFPGHALRACRPKKMEAEEKNPSLHVQLTPTPLEPAPYMTHTGTGKFSPYDDPVDNP